MKLFKHPVTLYRGITSKNLPKRYPGTFYTQNEELAKWYAKDGGMVTAMQFVPLKMFSIDKLITDESFRNDIKQKFEEYFSDKKDLSSLQLFDNIYDSVTDFSYPTEDDNNFLRSLGYDSVFFSHEGGDRVDSWYIF